jgi:hypothetical protein
LWQQRWRFLKLGLAMALGTLLSTALARFLCNVSPL